MGSVTTESRFISVTVDQLKQELALLSLAGYGNAAVDFKTGTTGFTNSVTVKVHKPISEKGKGSG